MMLKKTDIFHVEYIITEEIYKGFIKIFKDTNPLHLQKSYAIKKGFKDKVMHGNILNGFLSNFIGEKLPIKNILIISQEINYKNPFYLYDTLILTASIIDVFNSVNIVEFVFEFTNNNGLKIAKGKFSLKIL